MSLIILNSSKMNIKQYQLMSDTSSYSDIEALVDHLELLDQCFNTRHQDHMQNEHVIETITTPSMLNISQTGQNNFGSIGDSDCTAKQKQNQITGILDNQGTAFEQYLQQVTNKEQELKQKQKIKSESKKNVNFVRYVQKHRSPATIFNYHGIDIQVRLQKYHNFSGSCLVMAYNKLDYQNLYKLTNNRELCSAILHRFDQQILKISQQNQQLVTFCCYKYFPKRNYNFLYLIKKPEYRYMAEYSAKKLGDKISTIISTCSYYQNSESIVFTDFQWTGLQNKQKCEVFFWALLQFIHKQIKCKKMGLKKITVCCDNIGSYFDYTYQLREISDMYIRSGLINY